MIRATCLAAAMLPLAATAQQAASPGDGAVLRALDKVSGQSTNYELARGQSVELGQLTVRLRECRYPQGDATGDAFAYLDVTETGSAEIVFSGWMIASAPALNAMEHARYDVWVLRCKTS
ncbi:MAG: DUF2155 domain-containing protein [Pseudomonadota bacterium]